MPLEIHRPVVGNLDTSAVLPVSRGGTGETNVSDARISLDMLAAEDAGTTFAELDANGLLPSFQIPSLGSAQVSLSGLKTVSAGQTTAFKITNFSSFRDYQLSLVPDTAASEIKLVGDVLILNTVANGKTTAGFKVNGREFTVNVNI